MNHLRTSLLAALLGLAGCNQFNDFEVDLSHFDATLESKNPVGILHNGTEFCSITLLDTGNLLTAGHCAARDAMHVRFQNVGGKPKVIKTTKIIKKVFVPPQDASGKQTNFRLLHDFAILSVDDAEALIEEFSSLPLATEKDFYFAFRRVLNFFPFLEGEFLTYEFSPPNKAIYKRTPGLINLGYLNVPRFYETFKSIDIRQTDIKPRQSGSPFVVDGKIFGVCTHHMDLDPRVPGPKGPAAIITHTLVME